LLNAPLRFEPYLRPMVWGGCRLAEALGRPLPTAEPYGEAWLVSDHPSHRSIMADGPRAGRTLHDLLRQDPAALLGPAAAAPSSFPWLIKLLDAHDWLSVQVHPDDAAAARLWPGEGGKTEAWFILDAAPESRVYAGLKPGVDAARLRAALAAGTAADCLHSFTPRPGDCLFLPAGTVHAVGGGVLMAEVQQTSDATFRLYDWGRVGADGKPRKLHVEEALACIDWDAGPVAPVRVDGYPAATGPARQRLAECRYFTVDYVRDTTPFAVEGGRLQAAVALHGLGTLGGAPVRPGDALVLPAASAGWECVPDGPLGLLLASLP
jgi:mannose-6-phosphate isomerase